MIALDGSEIYPEDSGGGLLEDSIGVDVDDAAPVLVTEDPDVFHLSFGFIDKLNPTI